MSTFIDGIGQCQVLDKSSEIVDLKGHDITSLDKTGTFTWEHQSNTPATLVGKILKAKKIFSKADCSNDRETYYWNKCKAPYLYVMGELLDDYTASAKECAGQMKYSRDNPGQSPLLGFSIEGSEIPNTRKGMIITRSIARKVTLTAAPCNSMCVAEIFETDQKPQIRDEFEEIFKSEANAIEMFKSDEGLKIYEDYLAKKEQTGDGSNYGIKIGTTKSGKHVFSHGPIGGYGFNPAEHKEASEHHVRAALHSDNPKLIDNHIERMKLHNQAALSGGRQENRAARSLVGKDRASQATGKFPGLDKSEPQNWSKGKVTGDTVHYSHPQHGMLSIQKQPSGEFHVKHNGAMAGLKGTKGNFKSAKEAGKHARNYMTSINNGVVAGHKMQDIASGSMPSGMIAKAITAGNYNAAPGTLVNGAAYQVEDRGPRPKKDWNKRAKDDYERWPHKEKFEKFMQARMPHLQLGEIQAIGRTLALKKNVDFEKSLSNLVSLNKSEEVAKAENPAKRYNRIHPKPEGSLEEHKAGYEHHLAQSKHHENQWLHHFDLGKQAKTPSEKKLHQQQADHHYAQKQMHRQKTENHFFGMKAHEGWNSANKPKPSKI